MAKIKWSYEMCYQEALKYTTKVDFRKKSNGAYCAAYRNKWIKDFTWFKELCKPQNYWTYDRCYKEAKKYKCKVDFQKGKRGAYKAALREGWLNDYTWMKTPPAYNKKWDYETCLEESKKYRTLKDFREKAPKAVALAKKMGWLDEYLWIERSKKSNGYWTYDKCYEEAKKYTTRTDFENGNSTCYNVALKNKWIDDYYWIPKRKKIVSKWSKEICFEIGKTFKTKSEFERNEKGCYLAAMRAGWLQEMDWFVPAVIETINNFKKSHCIYVYKDEELNVAYIGLTSNIKSRHSRHKQTGSVYEYFKKIEKEIPQPTILKDNLTPDESRFFEDFYVNEFKTKGYMILNRARTGKYCGSFGGGRVIYTKEKSYEIAKQYEFLKDFYKENPSCYNRARRMGWLNDYKWLKHLHKKNGEL